MTLPLVALATVAAAAAALCALADGALLALDEDEPPAGAWPRALLGRQERVHRALASARIVALLVAGSLVGGALGQAGTPTAPSVLLTVGVSVALIVVLESAARTAGHAMADRALERWRSSIEVVELLFGPVAAAGERADAVLRGWLPQAPEREEAREASVEQFREVVAAEAETATERALVHGVFSLGDTKVREIMVPRVEIIGVDLATPWSEVVDRVRSARHARLVVFDGDLDEVIGILYAKDLLTGVLEGEAPADGWHALVRPALFIPATKTVDAQLKEFKATRRHIAIVVDEFGGTAGLVTLEDALELIVGEIRDEHDVEEPEFVSEDGARYWVDAKLTLEDLSERLGHDLARDDVTTVGGLVYELFGRVPRAGERVEDGPFRFVVERVVRRRVTRVYIERVSPADAGDASEPPDA